MDELEQVIYNDLSPSMKELVTLFLERNTTAKLVDAIKWAELVVEQQRKIMDKIISELPPIEEMTFIPLRELREQLQRELDNE
jgi:hypothetical protein